MPDDISAMSKYGLRDDDTATPMKIKFYHQVARALPEMTEWYENAMHTAIIRKDEVALAEILKKGTEKATLWETDTFGYAAVELLASWTRGLELLLFHCGSQVLQSDDNRVSSVLSFALSGSKERCSVSPPARCPHTCSCADNVVILLEAGCLIKLDDELLTFVLHASTRCQEAVVGHLKKRREDLAYLALNRLSPTEIKDFRVSEETILDIQTQEVVRALEKRDVQVPQRLQTQVVRYFDSKNRWSLYHLISASRTDTDTIHLLNMARSHGFGEVDEPDSTGRTPLMISTRPLTFMNLVRLGADPTRKVPDSVSGFTTTHHSFGILGRPEYRKEDFRMMIKVKEYLQLSYDFPSEDECICECAPYGCHPYSKLCKRMVRYRSSQWRQGLDLLSNRIAQVTKGHGDVPNDLQLALVRMATFRSLSIHHTCCLSEGKPRHIDDEDIQEFLEEDSRAIEKLHELLPEFEAKLVEMSCSFSEFMGTYWKDRMVQVLEELNEPQPLTEDNLRGIRRLGIDLQVGDEDGDGNKAYDKVKPKRGSLEYYMAQLDEIMEEAGV